MADALKQLQQLREQLPQRTPENVDLREEMLQEARKLMLDLERPDNVVERVAFQLIESVVIDTAIKMGLFRALADGKSHQTEELARGCNADAILVGRLLRCLASNGAVNEDGPQTYSANLESKALAQPENENAVSACVDFLCPAWLQIPECLKQSGWKNQDTFANTPLAKGHRAGENDNIWGIMARHPAKDAFMAYMGSFNAGHKEWTDFYPIEERLGQGADTGPDAVMMVDVGGGWGHQAVNVHKRFPRLPGRIIVQDIPVGLPAEADRTPEVEFMIHDFTTENPIKGARLYYLRYVLHDWPQDFNVNLCTQLRKAMKPGYSKLIVNEWIVPETGASRFMTAQDMNMLSIGGGMERTEALHRDYLERAGLKITKIFHPGDKISEAVIEAEVA